MAVRMKATIEIVEEIAVTASQNMARSPGRGRHFPSNRSQIARTASLC